MGATKKRERNQKSIQAAASAAAAGGGLEKTNQQKKSLTLMCDVSQEGTLNFRERKRMKSWSNSFYSRNDVQVMLSLSFFSVGFLGEPHHGDHLEVLRFSEEEMFTDLMLLVWFRGLILVKFFSSFRIFMAACNPHWNSGLVFLPPLWTSLSGEERKGKVSFQLRVRFQRNADVHPPCECIKL